jgi:tRNA (cmo5U34)-methyltransferase
MARYGQEWQDPAHVAIYRDETLADFPHLAEGDAVFAELLPTEVRRVLDLGCGDGRLIALVRAARGAQVDAVGLDLSEPMLAAARERLGDSAQLLEHNLANPLPDLGTFDLIVSGFAIHHLPDERKRALYGEVFDRLEPGGLFINYEHVASATPRLNKEFLATHGLEADDPSNQLVPVETQADWLRAIGFTDADCMWKWREIALLQGRKPA